MSDTTQSDGWWQANNGKWYPPENASDPTGTVNGTRVNLHETEDRLALKGDSYQRSYRYKTLTNAYLQTAQGTAPTLHLIGVDYSLEIESIQSRDPDALCSRIRDRIAIESGRRQRIAPGVATSTPDASVGGQRTAYGVVPPMARTQRVPIAKTCIVVGIIWLVGGTISTLAATFESGSDSAFDSGPSGGERLIAFLGAGSVTAFGFAVFFGFAVLIRLNLLVAARLTTARDEWGTGWFFGTEMAAISWGKRLSSGFRVAGGVAVAFGLIVGALAGQVESLFTGASSFNSGVFLGVLVAALTCALICVAMSASPRWRHRNRNSSQGTSNPPGPDRSAKPAERPWSGICGHANERCRCLRVTTSRVLALCCRGPSTPAAPDVTADAWCEMGPSSGRC